MWTEDEREFVAGVLEEERFRLNGQLEWWKEESSTYKKLQAEAKLCDAALAKLATAPDAQGEWQPVPDGMYEYPNWNDKGTVIIRILNDGAELEQWHNSLPDDIEEISLSSDYRLCQRKQNVQETESC